MVKPMSLARIKYQATYRQLRLNGGINATEQPFKYFDDAQDCAILSYDYHDRNLSGWINRQLWQQWYVLRSGLFNRDELPF